MHTTGAAVVPWRDMHAGTAPTTTATAHPPRPAPACATGASATSWPAGRRGGRSRLRPAGRSSSTPRPGARSRRRPPRAPAAAVAAAAGAPAARAPAAATTRPRLLGLGGERRPGRPAAGTSCSRTSCVSS